MLKPDRDFNGDYDITWYFDAAAEAGQFVVQKTGGGPSLDDEDNVAEVAADPSGKVFVGVVLNDVVDIDTTRVNKSSARNESFLNEKAGVWRRGWLVTDQLKSGETPVNGDIAVLAENGEIMVVPASWDPDDNPKVGTFRSTPDANGFVKVDVSTEPVSGQLSS